MKRKVARSRKVTRRVKRSSASRRSSTQIPFIRYQRIIVLSACVLLVVLAFATLNRGSITRSVAGVSIARRLFSQATVLVPQVNSAASYNIYYKQKSEASFTNAVRNVPTSTTTYTISYLKKGASYQYAISAVDANGKEFWWSSLKPLPNIKPM